MARPPLPIGAHGKINVTQLADGQWRAACRFRRADGTVSPLRRVRATRTKAETALKASVVIAVNHARGDGEIKPTTRVKIVAERWFKSEVELAVSEGRKTPKTRDVYRTYLDVHILPALGKCQMSEVDTVRCENLMNEKRTDGAKDDKLAGIRNVLSSVCAYAVRHGALTANPCRELSRLQRVKRKPVRALTAAERKDLLAKLGADEQAAEKDLPDILRALLATGVRIAEMLGCCGDDVKLDDPDRPRLVVAHRTTRTKGEGIVRSKRDHVIKGEEQELLIPKWSVPMFRARKLASGGPGPLFPDVFGGWRSNDSVTKPLSDATKRIGYDWVTSHVMRKTVAAVLKAAKIPVADIADQLGHSSTAITERHYLERPKGANDAQVQALEEGMM